MLDIAPKAVFCYNNLMSQTHTQTLPEYLKIPTGMQVYDAFMSRIEPELVSGNLSHIDEPYADETPEKRVARYKRYTKAFEKYDIQYNEWSLALSAAIQEFRRNVIRGAEAKSRTEESPTLNALEDQLTVAPVSHSA